MLWRVYSKLLNMRDFRARSGFPLHVKTRYNSTCGYRVKSIGLAYFTVLAFVSGRAIGQAKFRAYMLQTHP
jgi:hypothetical protein